MTVSSSSLSLPPLKKNMVMTSKSISNTRVVNPLCTLGRVVKILKKPFLGSLLCEDDKTYKLEALLEYVGNKCIDLISDFVDMTKFYDVLKQSF